jgi:hypothetical protein
MLRIAAAIAFVVAPFVAVAAPVPPPSEKELITKQWGKTEGEGEFELEGKQLTLRTNFGKPNHSFSWGERVSVPRTARTISGDFQITVRIVDAMPPGKETKHEGGSSETNAGIYIRGSGMSLRYCLGQSYQRFPGAAANQNMMRWLRIEANYPRGGASGSIKQAEDGKSAYLRLIRKGKDVSMSYSFDGEKWSAPNNPFRNIDMSIPDELTVGVFMSHSTYQCSHATFDGFTIEKLKEEKPKEEKPK